MDERLRTTVSVLLERPHSNSLGARRREPNVWSAQEFVDTELGALRVGLKYVRTDAAEVAVTPDRIVE